MRCTDPRTVGFKSDGKTISWSQKSYSKEFATFQLPCGQCIECRLEYARQWAVRCVHEAKMYDSNSFITLTYDDANLKSPKLDYRDFQLFMKRLRKAVNQQIGVFVAGEYGDQKKRPHWHALIFNWRPTDLKNKYTSDLGHPVYTSALLTKLWGKGNAELGSVTFESAGYCARYAAKKLIHGKDDEHDFQPISKKSSKHAIGKKFIEKFWPDVFNFGYIILPDGKQCSIPRYYEKWLRQNQPAEWRRYVTETKQNKIEKASKQSFKQSQIERDANAKRSPFDGHQVSSKDAKKIIQKQKFKMLQSQLKL